MLNLSFIHFSGCFFVATKAHIWPPCRMGWHRYFLLAKGIFKKENWQINDFLMNFCLLGVIKDNTLPCGAIMLGVFFKWILFKLLIVKLGNKSHRRDLSKCCVFNTDIHHTLERKHRPHELSSAYLLSKDKWLHNSLLKHSRKSLM